MHPELKDRARAILEEDLGGPRARSILLAVETVWTILGYPAGSPPFGRIEILVLASILAALLESEEVVRDEGVDWPDLRKRVTLRLIDGGRRG